MERSLPHARGPLQTLGYVLQVDKLTSHIPNDDKHYLLTTSHARTILHLYG